MPHKINNIHDKFIRQILSHKEIAIEFLSQYLPSQLTRIIDFETLTHQDISYINESLKVSYSDLIWRVKIKDSEHLKISLLLEHKSYADSKVVFQLLEYLAFGYRKQINEEKKTNSLFPFFITTAKGTGNSNPWRIILAPIRIS